jgi:hypothetical protein
VEVLAGMAVYRTRTERGSITSLFQELLLARVVGSGVKELSLFQPEAHLCE